MKCPDCQTEEEILNEIELHITKHENEKKNEP